MLNLSNLTNFQGTINCRCFIFDFSPIQSRWIPRAVVPEDPDSIHPKRSRSQVPPLRTNPRSTHVSTRLVSKIYDKGKHSRVWYWTDISKLNGRIKASPVHYRFEASNFLGAGISVKGGLQSNPLPCYFTQV